MDNYLIHYGTPAHSGRYPLGSGERPFQKFANKVNTLMGYQDSDGYLTAKGVARLERKDSKWANRNYNKLYNTAFRKSRKEITQYEKQVLKPKYKGKYKGAYYNNEYNRKLAEVMNTHVDKLPSAPSGKVVKFVAKRGELGVHLALADPNFDMSRVKNGVYSSGKIAYKKDSVGTA